MERRCKSDFSIFQEAQGKSPLALLALRCAQIYGCQFSPKLQMKPLGMYRRLGNAYVQGSAISGALAIGDRMLSANPS